MASYLRNLAGRRLLFRVQSRTVDGVNAWGQGLSAVLLAIGLANPLCLCPAEQSAAPRTCCGQDTANTGDPLAPSDCKTSIRKGLLLEKEDSTLPTFTPSDGWVDCRAVPDLLPRQSAFFRMYDNIHAPPLRHLYSVYHL